MSRLPPLNALRSFEAAARHLNFRLAGIELSVTQGAVAQQVRSLEAVLNVKLFERLPRGLSLTEVGRSYLKPVQQALTMIAEATDDIRPMIKTLNVSATPSFATKWLVPRLQDFTSKNPNIEVKISASESLANFQNDGIDIAIRQGKPPFGQDLSVELICPIEIFVVCSPGLLATDKQLQTEEDISNQILLHDAHDHWPVYFK